MSKILLITCKELREYFYSLVAYITLAAFLIIGNWLYMNSYFEIQEASMRSYFGLLPWMFLFFIPAITMRSWAEERKMGTLEFLLTQPVQEYELVIGKFLSTLAFMGIALMLTLTLAFTNFSLGTPDAGTIICSYLGAYLMAASFIAIGLYISSLCENQIIAFIVQIVLFFLLIIIGNPMILNYIPQDFSFLATICKELSIATHFYSMTRGVIDSRDVVYYLLIIGFFLYLNTKSVQMQRLK